MIDKLKGEGDIRTQVRVRRLCWECGRLATKRISYLMHNARSNPASSAYRHDDCTWCSDAEGFSCDEHQRVVERDAPEGMGWCGTFDGERFPHMMLCWEVYDD